ncbi:MAG: glycosyltransferase family 2 protein [Deltaproteobacteria bacterium]|nr:glycosyltransferase family 2 protein [Deltaproteobacteria bacterium]
MSRIELSPQCPTPDARHGGGAPALSVVVPVYNEAGNAQPLCREIAEVLAPIGRPFEILFVNDGSNDATLDELQALLHEFPQLRIIDLAGNFGEAAALCAGFDVARGDLVVTLDGDGQNDPHDIPALLAELERGAYRVVSGWRQRRQEGLLLRVLPSRIANAMIALVTRLPVHDNGCGLKIYRRDVVRGAQLPRGFNRFMPAIFGVRASEVGEVRVHDRRRAHGESHYGLNRTLIVLRDLLALRFLIVNPHATQNVAAALCLLSIAVHIAGIAVHSRLLLAPSGILAPLAGMIWWNAQRFQAAQTEGVFRVRREYCVSQESAGHEEVEA